MPLASKERARFFFITGSLDAGYASNKVGLCYATLYLYLTKLEVG